MKKGTVLVVIDETMTPLEFQESLNKKPMTKEEKKKQKDKIKAQKRKIKEKLKAQKLKEAKRIKKLRDAGIIDVGNILSTSKPIGKVIYPDPKCFVGSATTLTRKMPFVNISS